MKNYFFKQTSDISKLYLTYWTNIELDLKKAKFGIKTQFKI